jgi:hypothetical protein|tara:strand:+ start:249 stop:602 length:354 start_codon:yes stop_codon:yes gene_type:complete
MTHLTILQAIIAFPPDMGTCTPQGYYASAYDPGDFAGTILKVILRLAAINIPIFGCELKILIASLLASLHGCALLQSNDARKKSPRRNSTPTDTVRSKTEGLSSIRNQVRLQARFLS